MSFELPAPKSLLGRHRLLAPSAGVLVSPICLGGMNFGDFWKDMMGVCDKETTFNILEYFYQKGGNFIDTANSYQGEESEQWVGEWLEKTGRRDEFVVATKYTDPYKTYDTEKQQSHYGGNGTKSLTIAVDAALKKLRTHYIDILYVHYYDLTTSIPELMQSLNRLVLAGKVLYLGISDTPAWIVVKANDYARQHGLRQFSVYQGQWSAANRDFEREIIPMALEEGMALAPWGTLGNGLFKSSKVLKDGGRQVGDDPAIQGNEAQVAVVLEKVADRHNTLITSVALAYVFHKAPYVFPIIGGRKIEHLEGNIGALGLKLTPQDIDEIDNAYEWKAGFPHSFLTGSKNTPKGPGDILWPNVRGTFDFVERPKPITPKSE
ncbi:hypothetical protein NW767_015552 [Fusarium falciforme]|nr:hypothetical protein NW767_015552 [Fusarium falciforme]